MNLAQDVRVLLADFGVPVSAGGRTAQALVDSADELLMQNGNAPLIGRHIVATLMTGSVPVAVGGQLVIDGVAYRAAEVYRLDDGLLTRIVCAKGA